MQQKSRNTRKTEISNLKRSYFNHITLKFIAQTKQIYNGLCIILLNKIILTTETEKNKKINR